MSDVSRLRLRLRAGPGLSRPQPHEEPAETRQRDQTFREESSLRYVRLSREETEH